MYNNDYWELVDELQQDIVFMDPPWGGPGYRYFRKLSLFLGENKLSDVSLRLAGKTKWLALKVPVNFDTELFQKDVLAHFTLVGLYTKVIIVTSAVQLCTDTK